VARGWESKSIEAQQDAARERRGSVTAPSGAAPRSAERDTLQLARLKTLADLQRACSAPHRAMLERALADLDARIASLSEATLR
jgi:hypothetical protein